MLRQRRPDRRPRPTVSLVEVDDVLQTLLFHPADGLREGHGPGDLHATHGPAHDLDDRLRDELDAHGPYH